MKSTHAGCTGNRHAPDSSRRRGLMRKKSVVWLLLIAAILLVAVCAFVSTFSISAMDPPGRLETVMVTKAKRWLVSRNARGPLPPAPLSTPANVATGEMIFMGDCISCHGTDGRKPTDIGRSMYPRAPSLDSDAVQKWSDAELFWIIQHGIRLSGMPGFGKIHNDDQIWQLVQYVRSLRTQSSK
jgi:mono/diheme cytochrome c family protein